MSESQTYNEYELLLKIAEGDEEAYRYLMRIYFPVIVQFARKIVGHDAAAEDIAAETFIKLWEHRTKVDSLQNIKAFLFITCKNRCLNELRHNKREERRNNEFKADTVEEHDFIGDEIIRAEAMALILKAGTTLPEKMGRVFELSFLEGLPNREIAKQLNISTNTVKAQKARAIELIKEQLKDHHLLPSIIALLVYWASD